MHELWMTKPIPHQFLSFILSHSGYPVVDSIILGLGGTKVITKWTEKQTVWRLLFTTWTVLSLALNKKENWLASWHTALLTVSEPHFIKDGLIFEEQRISQQVPKINKFLQFNGNICQKSRDCAELLVSWSAGAQEPESPLLKTSIWNRWIALWTRCTTVNWEMSHVGADVWEASSVCQQQDIYHSLSPVGYSYILFAVPYSWQTK